jgi:hypothetical protein
MDKIITFIIISYIVYKFFSRFLSGEEGEEKGTHRHPPIPPHRKAPFPPSKTETRPASSPDFSSIWREVSQSLRDLKRQAEGQKEGIKIPEKIPIPHREVSVTQHTKRIKDAQKDRASIQKKIHPKKLTEETVPFGKAKTIREEKIERDYISFDQPGLFLQGIILSEILRPPMARRNHLLPPYLRR